MAVAHRPSIVAAVSGTPADAAVVRAAAAEAGLRSQPLLMVAAYQPPPSDAPPTGGWPPLRMARAALRDATDLARTTHPGLEVHGTAEPGTLDDVAVQSSATADLVVAGPRLSRPIAARVRCPMLVPRRSHAVVDGLVLVAVDAAAAGVEKPLEFGFRAADLRGVPLRAIFVWTQRATTSFRPVHPIHTLAAHREAERLLVAAFVGWQDKFPEVPVRADEIRAASIAGAVVRASASATLLVLGGHTRHGRTGPDIGAVVRAALTGSHCPVAIVP